MQNDTTKPTGGAVRGWKGRRCQLCCGGQGRGGRSSLRRVMAELNFQGKFTKMDYVGNIAPGGGHNVCKDRWCGREWHGGQLWGSGR